MRTLALILVAPPLTLLVWAQLSPAGSASELLMMVAAGAIGLAGIATAPWQDWLKATITVIYVAAAFALMPLLALFAICTTGNCI